MWWNTEHVIAPNEDFKIVTRERAFGRKFLWQIQVRGSLVAEGAGVGEFADEAMRVATELDKLTLTESARVLRELSLVLSG